jgi:hypothetical protein
MAFSGRVKEEDSMFQNFYRFQEAIKQRLCSFVDGGLSITVLTVCISVPAAVAGTIFTDTTPGPVDHVLGAGTYQIIATGAGRNPQLRIVCIGSQKQAA